MIKSDYVVIKISKRNKKIYTSLGYNCVVGDEILIKINELSPNSKIKIDIICDYCGKEFPRSYYNHSNQSKTNKINKDCCQKCIGKKNAESNMLTYGVDHVMHLDSVKNKIKETNLEKYGKEYYTQTEEYIEKIVETNIKKYGVSNVFQNKEIQDKQKQTVIHKYGVENVFQHEMVKEKSKETMLIKYGVEHPMHHDEIKNQVIRNAKNTLYKNGTAQKSKQQIYLNSLLGGELNYQIGSFNLDIAFPSEMIYVEYDGGGHDLQVKMKRISQEDLKREELKRYFFLKSKGWKEIRIISPRDYLPDDNILIKEFNKAKSWLKSDENGHSHYHIYISDKVNDKNFGKLRKIKLPL